MYTLLIIILVALAIYLVYRGVQKKSKAFIINGILIAILTWLFFSFLDFYGEMLWFQQIGYGDRFWTEIGAKALFLLAGFVLGWILAKLCTLWIPRSNKSRTWIPILAAAITAIWSFSNWSVILKFWNRVSTGTLDPILNKDVGFYLFTLPLLDRIYELAFALTLLLSLSMFAILFIRIDGNQLRYGFKDRDPGISRRLIRGLLFNIFLFILVLAAGKILNRYALLYSTWGAVTGPGWTDVHIRQYAYILVTFLTILLGITLFIPAIGKKYERIVERKNRQTHPVSFQLGTTFALLFFIWFLFLTLIPGLFQWLRVEPNEITFEKEYIANNIEFTRKGFNLQVEEREFPVKSEFNRSMVEKNQYLINNIRLWDWRALDAVYKQFQEIRLYYEFVDVDIDRYHFADTYRQVMVSAREMQPQNLPTQSQTFVNKRFKYTHGYGITLTPVSEFTPNGLPNLLVKDIPPKSKHPALEVATPEIYYGELTTSHVVANSKEKEFDYPSGEKNVYTRYQGSGGVPLSSLWRKFLYGYKFDGTRFFLSQYPTDESRLMFHRHIVDRVKQLAPFIRFDEDPYIALIDGDLYWIIDGYTASGYYPYSEPFRSTEIIEYKQGNQTRTLRNVVAQNLNGMNYLRNSVKTVVNAYSGEVHFYIYDDEPLIQVWQNIFPELFSPKEEMPMAIKKHVRYPADMLLVQGLVYAKYHMTDPTVFYNQEDLWVRATEKYYNRVLPVEPYYIMWELPGSDNPEFVLIMPFTPKNRQVLIGWIAGMCDPQNYGRFLAYKFPKEKRVLGTQQVETKIDQDRFLSGQLTLWDQRGSNVIRGNVLAIPVEETLLYVEPIYLQAETAAYPELRLVVLMHNDQLSYAESFDKALEGLLEGQRAQPGLKTGQTPEKLIEQANQAFNDYISNLNQRNYQQSARALQELENTLNQLSEQNKLQ
jgi:hypothetical protein